MVIIIILILFFIFTFLLPINISKKNSIFFTILAIFIGYLPILVDATETHLHNPNWSSHARLHLAWLLSTNFIITTFAILLCWIKNLKIISLIILFSILGGYYFSIFTRHLYGGTINEPGGVEDTIMGVEAGIFFFTSLTFFWIITFLSVYFFEFRNKRKQT